MDSTLTAAQGRVLFHLGRLFRSTGAGIRELGEYRRRISETMGAQALADVGLWSTADCVRALQIMEDCARPMSGFRDVRTGWEDFT